MSRSSVQIVNAGIDTLKMNLYTLGVHPKVVQELLGHNSISITMDIYSHLLPSMQDEAMGKMDDAFKLEEKDEDQEDEKQN